MGGATIFKNLESYLAELGRGWADFSRILDWGCGAGRVTRYMLSETGCGVTGADIDLDNIAWCRQAYPDGRFEQVPLRPPTAFEDGAFDLVVGLSVLTHLREDDQWLWLSELQRIVRPGGLAFLPVQGPTQFAYNRFPPHLYRQVQERGYLDLSRNGALDAVIGDTEYYRAAMHSRPYITQRWNRYFEVVAIVDAIAGLQDFVVLRRR
jgi:SAM-dependent methyltransferase